MAIYLKKFTSEGQFKSIKNLCEKAIKSKYLTKNLSGLNFDSTENRFHNKKLRIENKILQYDTIHIKNSTEIHLINCIIIGKLSILDCSGEISSVYMDNCIVTKSIRFYGCSIAEIDINDCNLKNVDFYNCKIKKAHFHNCSILSLNFTSARIIDFSLFCNKIYFITKYASKINNFSSSGNVINLKDILTDNFQETFNPINFVNNNFNYISDNVVNKHYERIETINFLEKNNLLTNSTNLNLIANYELMKLSCDNKFTKIIVKLFQGFNNPLLLLSYALGTVFIFSFIYYYYGSLSYNKEIIDSYWQCFYFSGITFTTIGYGDIQPINITKFIAMTEGFIGVILSSSILVSMVNRFSKNN